MSAFDPFRTLAAYVCFPIHCGHHIDPDALRTLPETQLGMVILVVLQTGLLLVG